VCTGYHVIISTVIISLVFSLPLLAQSSAKQSEKRDSQQTTFEEAVHALGSGDYTAAEAGFRAVLKSAPNNIGALGNLGIVYSRTGQTDKAITVYRKALAIQPNEPQLLLNLGLAYLKAELEAEALPIFRRLVIVHPVDIRAQELLATAEIAAGNPVKGVTMLEHLRQSDQSNPALLYLLGTGYLKAGKREQARRAFDELFRSTPASVASLAMCKAYYRSGLLEEAERECRSAQQGDPSLDGVERELGKVLVSRRDASAADWLRKAAQRSPTDAEALYFLGAVLVSSNQTNEAIPILEQARALNPSFWGNYFYLGRARLQQGAGAEAVALLQHAAELNPSESSVYYQLGRAYTRTGQVDRAKQAMARVRELKAQELTSDSVPVPPAVPNEAK
jgi:Flp pilus assembly protein TadD